MNVESNQDQNTPADKWADKVVAKLFAGRTGHGGTEGVTYLQMRPDALREVAKQSFQAGVQHQAFGQPIQPA